MAGKRKLCSVSHVCKIARTSVVTLGPNDSIIVGIKRRLHVPRGGARKAVDDDRPARGGSKRQFRAVGAKRALCHLAMVCKLSTQRVYGTGPKLDTRGFGIKRIVMVPRGGIISGMKGDDPGIARPGPLVKGRRKNASTRASGIMSARAGYGARRVMGHGRGVCHVDHVCNVARVRLVGTGPRLHRHGLGHKRAVYVPCPRDRGKRMIASSGASVARGRSLARPIVPSSRDLFTRSGKGTRGVRRVGTTVVLPFVLRNSDLGGSHTGVIRFCRKFLLTLSDLGGSNISVSLRMCSSNGKGRSVGGVLGLPRVERVGVVFNPIRRGRVTRTTTFTSAANVHMMVPFSHGMSRIFAGPCLCRIGAPRDCFCSRMCSRFFLRFPRPGIVFFSSPRRRSSNVVTNLGRRLSGHRTPCAMLPTSATAGGSAVHTHLDLTRRGVLVVGSRGDKDLGGVVPMFRLLIHSATAAGCSMRLFNCPRCRICAGGRLTSFCRVSACFCSSFCAGGLLPRTISCRGGCHQACDGRVIGHCPGCTVLKFSVNCCFLGTLRLCNASVRGELGRVGCDPVRANFGFRQIGG